MFRETNAVPARQSFLQGTLLLTGGLLLVKVIGALFKIPLSAVIGEAGMGYFSTAYSFCNVIFSVAAAGLPVAVSRMVSAQDALGHRRELGCIRRTAVPLFFAAGAAGTVLMVVSAPLYARAVGNPGALPAMLALAPSAALCSAAAAFRGWHEGRRNMVPTAVSQVIEALSKLLFGLSGAWLAVRFFGTGADSETWGAAAAVFGVTLGAALSLLYLSLYRDRDPLYTEKAKFRRTLAGKLLRTALPVSLGAAATSLSGLIDASFLQTRTAEILRHRSEALLSMYAGSIPADYLEDPSGLPNYLFGCYNMALTLFMLIPSVTQTVGVSALPSVTHAFASGDKKVWQKAAENVLRVTFLAALPMGLGLSAMAGPVVRLVYGSRPSEGILTACLTVMGIAAVFAAVTTPLTSLLQAAGHMELPVFLTVGGLIVKIILNYILAGIPEINIQAGGISTGISWLLVTVAEVAALRGLTGLRCSIGNVLLKPLAASVCSTAAALEITVLLDRAGFSGRLHAVPGILAAVAVYALVLWLLGGLEGLQSDAEKNTKRIEKYLKNTGG